MDHPRSTRARALRSWLPAGWIALVTLVLTGPLLLPGFVLSYDMVFTPQQDLLPASLGLGAGLPRAVPQDAVVAIIEYVVPGMLLQKFVLMAIPLLTGFGMLHLLRGAGGAAGLIAATLAMVAPFVTERLVLGHWGLLLAYAITPWSLAMARRVRAAGSSLDVLRLVLLIAICGLTPTGSIFATALALPIAVGPGSALTWRVRVYAVIGVFITWLPWLLPALLHPSSGVSDTMGATVFALRSEGAWGSFLTALGTGGVWNGEVVPASRELIVAPIVAVALVLLSLAGAQTLLRTLGRAAVVWWSALAALGLVAAVLSGTSAWAWWVSEIPGAGLMRDAHKLLAPLTLLLAAAAGVGLARVAHRIPDRSGALALVIAGLVLPLAFQPDVLWGAGGRLRPVDYPPAWSAMRDHVAASDHPGDVAVLPWTAFRRYAWNGQRTVLDPAPRWLPRSSVVADTLVVDTPAGLVTVGGDDPRAAALAEIWERGGNLPATLADLGIGWVLLDGPGDLPLGLTETWTQDDLVLAQIRGPLTPRQLPVGAGLVIAADLIVVIGLVGGIGLLAASRLRRVNRRPSGKSLLP